MSDRALAQKMYVKNAKSLAVLGADPIDASGGGGEAALIAALPPTLIDHGDGPVDLLLMFARNRRELEHFLPLARARLNAKGALWVAYLKGGRSGIDRDSIMAFAEANGLTGAAIISVDAAWSCLRLKIA